MGWPRAVPLPPPGRRGRHVSTVKWRFPSPSGSIQRQYIFQHSNTPIDSTFRAESVHVPNPSPQQQPNQTRHLPTCTVRGSGIIPAWQMFTKTPVASFFAPNLMVPTSISCDGKRKRKKNDWPARGIEPTTRVSNRPNGNALQRQNNEPSDKSGTRQWTLKKKNEIHIPPPLSTRKKKIPLQKGENVTGKDAPLQPMRSFLPCSTLIKCQTRNGDTIKNPKTPFHNLQRTTP